MKTVLVLIGCLLTGLFSRIDALAGSLEDLYIQARSELKVIVVASPHLNVWSTEFAAREQIEKQQYALAEFLCAKLATRDHSDLTEALTDAILLRDVAGIDLFWSEKLLKEGVDMEKSLQESFQRFKGDYAAKLFEHPEEAIAKASANFESKSAEKLKPADVFVLRRYGIFGVPALIEEVRRNDSKHAFAALLILLGKVEEYGIFLEQSSTLYPTKLHKLEAVKNAVRDQEAQQEVRSRILDQIVKAAG